MKQIKKHSIQANAAPHTGKMLKAFYKKNRIYKAALARTLNRAFNTIADYEKNHTIQTALLWEICHALKHNFFADIAALLPTTYSVTAPPDTSKDERIAQLEQEVALLKAKHDSLMEALKG